MSDISRYLSLTDTITRPLTSNMLYVQDRHVGFEAERESVADLNWKGDYILVTQDDSLRFSGKEFKFNGPLINKDIISALKELKQLFSNCTVTHSTRTSDHIHINIIDFDQEDLLRLFRNYLVIEPTLFSVGQIKFDRKYNSYCVPHWYYLQEVNGGLLYEHIRDMFVMPKYLALRFSADFGTAEFRMWESTDDIFKILLRINLCLEIVQSSKDGVDIFDQREDYYHAIKKLVPRSFKNIEWAVRKPKLEVGSRTDSLLIANDVKDGSLRGTLASAYIKDNGLGYIQYNKALNSEVML